MTENKIGAAMPQAIFADMGAAHERTIEAKLMRRRTLRAIALAGGAPALFGRSLREVAVDNFPHWPSIAREYLGAQFEVALGLEPCRLGAKECRLLKPIVEIDPPEGGIELTPAVTEALREAWSKAESIDPGCGQVAIEQAVRYVRALRGLRDPDPKPSAAQLRQDNESLREMYDDARGKLLDLQRRYNALLADKLPTIAEAEAPAEDLLRGVASAAAMERDEMRRQNAELQGRLANLRSQNAELRQKYENLMRTVARQPYRGRSFAIA